MTCVHTYVHYVCVYNERHGIFRGCLGNNVTQISHLGTHKPQQISHQRQLWMSLSKLVNNLRHSPQAPEQVSLESGTLAARRHSSPVNEQIPCHSENRALQPMCPLRYSYAAQLNCFLNIPKVKLSQLYI